MEGIVKFRLTEYFKKGRNPLQPDQDVFYLERAVHGEKISTEEAPTDGTADPGTHYGCSEDQYRNLAAQGVFFAQEEVEARDVVGPDVLSTTAQPGIGRDPGATIGEGHPLSFDEMSQDQLQAVLSVLDPDAETLVGVVARSATPETLAEYEDGVPEAALAINEYLGRGESVGPEGSEGVQSTLPDGDQGGDSSGGSSSNEGPSEAAITFAEENDIDLSEVKGSGTGGRVTKPDVERYLKEREAARESEESGGGGGQE
jgi:pyruvate/2-oxoglutarate dehydrogenase complex dihydrolipoamide acyltransferase (E2) component